MLQACPRESLQAIMLKPWSNALPRVSCFHKYWETKKTKTKKHSISELPRTPEETSVPLGGTWLYVFPARGRVRCQRKVGRWNLKTTPLENRDIGTHIFGPPKAQIVSNWRCFLSFTQYLLRIKGFSSLCPISTVLMGKLKNHDLHTSK